MQLARDYKAVPAVVAFAANYGNAIRSRKVLQDELGDGRAGVFHQGERVDPEALGSGAIDLAHLGCGGDLHARSVAQSSSRRKPSGSPIAMRWSPTWMTSSGGGLKRMCESSPMMASTTTPISWRMREASSVCPTT